MRSGGINDSLLKEKKRKEGVTHLWIGAPVDALPSQQIGYALRKGGGELLLLSPDQLSKGDFLLAPPPGEVLARPLSLPKTKAKHLPKLLSYQAETLLPMKPEEIALSYQILSEDSLRLEVMLFLMRRERLKEITDSSSSPSCRILPPHLALALFAQKLRGEREGEHLLLHLDAGGLLFLLLSEKGRVMTAHTLRHTSSASLFEGEAKRALLALQKGGRRVSGVFLSGSWERAPELKEELLRETGLEEWRPEPPPQLLVAPSIDLAKEALSIGLALLGAEKHTPEFLKMGEAAAWDWKKIRSGLLLYPLLLTLLMGVVVAFGWKMIREEERGILHTYDLYAEALGWMPRKSSAAEEALSLARSSLKEEEKTGFSFPLHPQLPRLRDLLLHLHQDWIPRAMTEAGIEEGAPSLRIQECTYRLVSHPTPQNPQAHYAVDVELLLESASPRLARAFHEVLRGEKEWIDPTKKIDWSMRGEERYRVLFRLSDRTPYRKGKR